MAVTLVVNLQAQPVTALKIEEVSSFYGEPYLLDFNFALRDQNERAVIIDPAQITVVCKEDGAAISASETGFRLLAAANKQLKCFLVLDYTLSMADPAVNGDTDGDGISDAIETMETAAKTLIGTLNADAQVGLYEFHREDTAHPPQKVSDLTVDKAGLTNHIDRIWSDYVQFFPAATRVWDAVYAAVQEYPTTRLVDEQRVVVFLSDGRDESSTRTPNDVISSAQARGVKVYAIGFGNELTPAPLQSIATSTGGRFYAALTVAQLAARFQQITDDLRGNYVLRWATLKRSGSFTPSFTLTYQSLSPTYIGTRYSPGGYAGDVLQGRLVFDAALDEGVATVGLRAYYVPRFITRIRLNYTTDKPLTVQKVAVAEGGVAPDNWVFEHNAAQGWIELRSPNPQNIFTALPYATQGKLVRFALSGVKDLSTCFSNFTVDNTLYSAGGQSFRILNTSLVGRQGQTIAFSVLSDRTVNMSPFIVSATASSGLPVTFRIASGPATLNGSSVGLTGTGRVTIRAEQAGNEDYGAAFAEQSFEVIDKLPHGTPLEWLAQYGLTNNLVRAELLDLDGDGSAMWEEYWAGTNPTNAASVLALSGQFLPAGGWQISFLSQMFRKYRLDYSDDLLTWVTWQAEVPGDGTVKSYAASPTVGKRFYRLVQTEFKEPPGMVWIEPGTFTMGSPDNEVGRQDNEGPQTRVTISHGFWMGKYEVTQAEYQAVMGSNPSIFKGDLNRPVEQVSWTDSVNYCAKLTERERSAGRLPAGYVHRLPTEAEWEYAVRAGSTTRFSYGEDPGYTKLGDYAWYEGNSSNTTHPVGQKLANAWGLYDMAGNTWEWCLDWYGTYPGGNVTDPRGPASGSLRVIRGGSWNNNARICRSAFRYFSDPDFRIYYFGFRIVLAPGQ
jgi:formylglycine-generating enzyme required for sulfatase activity